MCLTAYWLTVYFIWIYLSVHNWFVYSLCMFSLLFLLFCIVLNVIIQSLLVCWLAQNHLIIAVSLAEIIALCGAVANWPVIQHVMFQLHHWSSILFALVIILSVRISAWVTVWTTNPYEISNMSWTVSFNITCNIFIAQHYCVVYAYLPTSEFLVLYVNVYGDVIFVCLWLGSLLFPLMTAGIYMVLVFIMNCCCRSWRDRIVLWVSCAYFGIMLCFAIIYVSGHYIFCWLLQYRLAVY